MCTVFRMYVKYASHQCIVLTSYASVSSTFIGNVSVGSRVVDTWGSCLNNGHLNSVPWIHSHGQSHLHQLIMINSPLRHFQFT